MSLRLAGTTCRAIVVKGIEETNQALPQLSVTTPGYSKTKKCGVKIEEGYGKHANFLIPLWGAA
jgi:hypothetical protein